MRMETGHPTQLFRGMCRAELRECSFCPVGWTGKEWFSELDSKATLIISFFLPQAAAALLCVLFSFHGCFGRSFSSNLQKQVGNLMKNAARLLPPCCMAFFKVFIESQNNLCWKGPPEVAWSDPQLRAGSLSKLHEVAWCLAQSLL